MVWNDDILRWASRNPNFREVLVTGRHSQVVVMSLPPDGEIGAEVHPDVDQVLVIVEGVGEVIADGLRSALRAGHLVHVPAGTSHNIINTGRTDLKLYTLYAPPQHAPGTIHLTRADAQAAEASEAAEAVAPLEPAVAPLEPAAAMPGR